MDGDRPCRLAAQIDYPPIRFVRFTGPALIEGVERHRIESVEVPITDPARTIVDCFRYRTKVGLDVAMEGLREGLRRRRCTPDQLWIALARRGSGRSCALTSKQWQPMPREPRNIGASVAEANDCVVVTDNEANFEDVKSLNSLRNIERVMTSIDTLQPNRTAAELHAMAVTLEASGEYKVLRKLRPRGTILPPMGLRPEEAYLSMSRPLALTPRATKLLNLLWCRSLMGSTDGSSRSTALPRLSRTSHRSSSGDHGPNRYHP